MFVQRMAAAVVLTLAVLGVSGAARAQVVDEDRDLARLSAQAESAAQHARVASLLRDRAATLENEARRLQRTARRLEQGRFPHEYKLPAIQQPGYRERQRAREARTQAREQRLRAARHEQSAVALNADEP